MFSSVVPIPPIPNYVDIVMASPSKKSVFVRKSEIEINACEDNPSSPFSEML
jgi:hypothetical protein